MNELRPTQNFHKTTVAEMSQNYFVVYRNVELEKRHTGSCEPVLNTSMTVIS